MSKPGAKRVLTSALIMPVIAICLCFAPSALAEGEELIGKPAHEFKNLQWLQGGPLLLGQLKGKQVVLLRFWSQDCDLCKTTAPLLNHLFANYGKRGLTVIGIHTPKTPAARNNKSVLAAARELGFHFPVAQDLNWQTLRAIWFDQPRSFTSATLLIDKQGRICWLHQGGALEPSSKEAAQLKEKLAELLPKG